MTDFFITADTPCLGHHSTWVEEIEVVEPNESSFVVIQDRNEFIEGGYGAADHIEWVVTFDQAEGSTARLLLTDITLRRFLDQASHLLWEAPIEREPKVEEALEEEYAGCDA